MNVSTHADRPQRACVFVLCIIIYHDVNLIAEDATKYYYFSFFSSEKAQFFGGTRACHCRWFFHLNNRGDKSSHRDPVENGLSYIRLLLFATILADCPLRFYINN